MVFKVPVYVLSPYVHTLSHRTLAGSPLSHAFTYCVLVLLIINLLLCPCALNAPVGYITYLFPVSNFCIKRSATCLIESELFFLGQTPPKSNCLALCGSNEVGAKILINASTFDFPLSVEPFASCCLNACSAVPPGVHFVIRISRVTGPYRTASHPGKTSGAMQFPVHANKSAARALEHEASSSYEIILPRADERSSRESNKK